MRYFIIFLLWIFPALAMDFSKVNVATPAFDGEGRLWLVWAAGNKVEIAHSQDLGQSFSQPVTIVQEMANIDANGEGRPKLSILDNKTILVTYAVRKEKSFNGTIFQTRSTDGGKNFSKPLAVIEEIGQRFDTMGIGPDGTVYLAFIDKRNLNAAKANNLAYTGAGIALAWSEDKGASLKGKNILADHSCECCRLGMAFDNGGAPVLVWRHIFGTNIRDHAIARFDKSSGKLTPKRISEDDWAVDACPHHGPSLTIDKKAWHVVWYTGSKKRPGLFYAQTSNEGESFSPPLQFGNSQKASSNPYILAANNQLFLVWKEFDGLRTTIMLKKSEDSGLSWSNPQEITATSGHAEHPLLISNQGKVYLSWLTKMDGYKLLAVE